MTNIDKIMYLIHWNRSEEEQREGIALAREVVCINAFFQPYVPGNSTSKGVWDNCAIIISERSDKELIPYTSHMIRWLEDLNWPGAIQIQQRLIEFQDVEWLAVNLKTEVAELEKLGKTSWLMFLSDLLKNQKLSQALNSCTREILAKYYAIPH